MSLAVNLEGGLVSVDGIRVRIPEVLRERGFTDAVKLAYESGISYGTAYSLISGKDMQRIDLTTLARLCRLLSVEVGDLLVYEHELGQEGSSE
jgi:DNA-binding Xre family transcriptional regulator